MSLFDVVPGLSNTIGTVASTVGSGLQVAGRLAGALNNLSNPANVASAIRSLSIPAGAIPQYNKNPATATAGAGGEDKDWRVRLSIPLTQSFQNSNVLAPLKAAGGLVFPYTPTIQIAGTASYETTPIVHQNYAYYNYINSVASSISISGPFNVEDSIQAQYWIAAVHYLRSVTKMFTGDSDNSGNPPPMVYLNGYGNYVFKNIPVVITSFTVELPQDVAYIATTVNKTGPTSGFIRSSGGSNQRIENTVNLLGTIGGIAGSLGAAKVSRALGSAANLVNVANNISNLAQGATGGGSSPFSLEGETHVPVKSVISVTCQPVYSRNKVRQFNLDSFVQGAYIKSKPGYL